MSGPTVIVTGASSGIGAAVAVEFARSVHANVVLLARRMEQLEAVAEQVREAGGQALPIPCDVSDAAAVQLAVDRTRAEFGPVDIALANAGMGTPMSMKNFTAERVERTMAVNFLGATHLYAAVLPHMLERGSGTIVGVSSIAGFRGLPSSGPYSASKAALSTMLESMRLELRGRGITVTTVHPGFVKTPMTDPNSFPMPFLVSVDRAAKIVTRGILKRRREVNFPWQMVLLMRLVRWMPDWIYDRVMGGRSWKTSS